MCLFVSFVHNCIEFSGLASSFPFNSIVCVCMSHHAVAFRREHLVCWFFYVIFSSFFRGGESWHFLSRLEGNFQIVRHLFSVDRNLLLLLMGDEKMISTWRTLLWGVSALPYYVTARLWGYLIISSGSHLTGKNVGGLFFHPLAWGLNYCYFIVIYDFLLCVCVFLIGGLVNFLKGILG